MRLFFVSCIALLTALLTGCQSVSRVEFYEPTPDNAAFCVKTNDKVMGHGPVKSIEGKSGAADFSDNKTFSFKFNILGL